MIKVMNYDLTEEQYIKLLEITERLYNWNGLSYIERQEIIKEKILMVVV